jgi:hypothetical protein
MRDSNDKLTTRLRRPRKDRRGFDLIGDGLPLGLLWFEGPDAIADAVNYTKFYSLSQYCLPPEITTCYPRSVNRNIFYIIGVIVVIVIVLKVLHVF